MSKKVNIVKCASVALTLSVVLGVAAAEPLFDFESRDAQRAAPRLNRKTYGFGVTNFCATSGRNAFVMYADKWNPGDYEWPAFTMNTPVNDWSKYDRLVLDVVNLGDDGDVLSIRIAGPDGKPSLGLARSLPLPAWGHRQWIVDLKYWPKEANPTNITRVNIYTHKPQSMCAFFDRFTLLRPGEALPPAPKFDARSSAAIKVGRMDYDRRCAARRKRFVDELAAENVAAGVRPDGFLVGKASSMEGIRPKDTFSVKGPKDLSLRLARNEREALQILVTPISGDLKDVAVNVSPLKLKVSLWKRFAKGVYLTEDSVKVSVMGYVETKARPRYQIGYNVATNAAPGYKRVTKRTPLGWWPDPILDFMDSCDVKDGDVQSFWVNVHAPVDAVPGLYEGRVTVSAKGRKPASFPFSVKVDDFEIPKTAPFPMLISFSPSVYVRPDQHGARDRDFRELVMKTPDSPLNLWKNHKLEWGDFLADHFITMMPLYQHRGDLPYDVWERLSKQGRMGYYNLCYASSQSLNTPERQKKWTKWSDWLASVIAKRYEEAKAHGLETNCVFYCCDETPTNRFGEIDAMLEKLKGRFPHIPFATTAYDNLYGTGKHLRKMDIFNPQTIRFDPETAEKSRAEGHKVWWYYACDQRAPYANAFTECQPIEQRLLMGAKAAKWRPDGFLYYQIAYFNSLNCITSGPYTSWDPRSWWNEHGDATWVAVGPDGRPLSTQRLENFRDGLEDLWYAKMLRERLDANPDAAWAARARELLAVPRSVVDSLSNYTDDPDSLYEWRNAMADMLSATRTTGISP